MRFRRWPRPTPYEDTPRKRAAFARKQRLEREALPLYASEIAENQHSADEEMARRAVTWDRVEHSKRAYHALKWREARARLFAFPESVRLQIRRIWRDCPYPPDHAYFCDLLRQIQLGKEDPYRPSWTVHAALKAKTTPNPTTFAETFKQIGRPPSSPNAAGPIMLYCGNLGSGILFLRATPLQIGENDAFLDLEVTGPCSDDELALIGRLAQADRADRVVALRRGAEMGNASTRREAV
ncbi:hypothetical protein SAMN06265338_1326 [Rhodoblastus acidophilus]|uniref:Uncharacterized protein n=1 Tax=Rhodoblastus acidophilus TaxID=1074 RepID=A0A212SEF6_RHOAC|nr:hypothetical protein [Rhodoblastus acidophilus]PPQ35158.1 hypothetical protein CKO16_21015 [Rhodoblastus acidophilus]RAI16903.1 hypothetical protein CH337_18935 [Rhodoblastus acidophilus]SNB84010.1 hypothetical protein SAMN06265338_1326 [Rhodoblastus acidophilus]